MCYSYVHADNFEVFNNNKHELLLCHKQYLNTANTTVLLSII